MHVPGLRSAYVKTGGIVYFARMLDKIRLQAKGKLPAGYNLGVHEYLHFDARCTRFLGVNFDALLRRVGKGGTDRQILEWCFRHGRKPGEEETEIWNTFMQKRGWKDGSSPGLERDKRAAGLARRKDIQTWFDLFDADERPGRSAKPSARGQR
jgi:gluconokinase